MSWLLTEHSVSSDLWWQMIDHESLKLVWLKWVWGEEGLLRPGPLPGKTESVHPSTSLTLGRSTNIWEGCAVSSGPQSRPCPSLTWPSFLPPAHFGVVNSCLLSWTSSWPLRLRSIPFRCFHKILCTGPFYALIKTVWWLFVYLSVPS